MKSQVRNISKHILAIAIFFVLTIVYFAPSIFSEKTIPQGDVEKFEGMYKEIGDYIKTEEGNDYGIIAWTGNMFSGMPAYTIGVPNPPQNFLNFIEAPIKALNKHGGSIVLLALICFYILMSAIDRKSVV